MTLGILSTLPVASAREIAFSRGAIESIRRPVATRLPAAIFKSCIDEADERSVRGVCQGEAKKCAIVPKATP